MLEILLFHFDVNKKTHGHTKKEKPDSSNVWGWEQLRDVWEVEGIWIDVVFGWVYSAELTEYQHPSAIINIGHMSSSPTSQTPNSTTLALGLRKETEDNVYYKFGLLSDHC